MEANTLTKKAPSTSSSGSSSERRIRQWINTLLKFSGLQKRKKFLRHLNNRKKTQGFKLNRKNLHLITGLPPKIRQRTVSGGLKFLRRRELFIHISENVRARLLNNRKATQAFNWIEVLREITASCTRHCKLRKHLMRMGLEINENCRFRKDTAHVPSLEPLQFLVFPLRRWSGCSPKCGCRGLSATVMVLFTMES